MPYIHPPAQPLPTPLPFNKRSKPRNLLEKAELIWPEAEELLRSLVDTETMAAQHDIWGPAASSDAWPLDGYIDTFERTAANEDAYHVFLAVKRMAAVAQVLFDESTGSRVEDVEEAVRAADSAAASLAMLYTEQAVTPLEHFCLECLAEQYAGENCNTPG